MSFHDGWQSGQLLSRATTDLSVIRRFLSFGLIFLVINFATFVTVLGLLLYLYWPLGLVVAVSAAPLYWISLRFTKRYNAIARQMQDEQGDLATLVEESAGGIRIIKAFGRRDHMAAQFDARARLVHDTGVEQDRDDRDRVAPVRPGALADPGDRGRRRRDRRVPRPTSRWGRWSRSSRCS